VAVVAVVLAVGTGSEAERHHRGRPAARLRRGRRRAGPPARLCCRLRAAEAGPRGWAAAGFLAEAAGWRRCRGAETGRSRLTRDHLRASCL